MKNKSKVFGLRYLERVGNERIVIGGNRLDPEATNGLSPVPYHGGIIYIPYSDNLALPGYRWY